jgi:hypothetical protein
MLVKPKEARMMKTKNTFDKLLLIARPAAGKSEIIDHLKHTDIEQRVKRYHIAELTISITF